MLGRLLFGLILAVSTTAAAAADLKLIMFEQHGCVYCERWKAEIAPIYPKTAEGKAAPLQIINIHEPLPKGISLKSRPYFTPTFVLIDGGVEIQRLEGYAGDDFFWVLLEELLIKSGKYKS